MQLQIEECPSEAEWRKFRIGVFDDDSANRLARHLESCRDCASTVENVADDADTFVEFLRRGDSPPEAEPALERMIAGSLRLPSASTGDRWEGRRLRDYTLLRRIGVGGMGAVYEARHERLGRPVAVKILVERLHPHPAAWRRFEREILASGRIDHPNVVRATDAGEFDGALYLVMEHLEGVDLQRLVGSHGRLEVADACEIARQAALALDAIATHGLVHRDVKPSNLMLTAQGKVKVLDLGLARLREAADEEKGSPAGADHSMLTNGGAFLGTADYMPPEQWGGAGEADVRSDLYALGGTLYCLLAGAPPFAHRKGVAGKREAHLGESPPPLSSVRGDVPRDLWKLIAELLAKLPSDRPDSAEAVAKRLESFANGADLSKLAQDSSGEVGATAEWTPPEPVTPVDRQERGRMAAWVAGLAVFALAVASLFSPPVRLFLTNSGEIEVEWPAGADQAEATLEGPDSKTIMPGAATRFTVRAGRYGVRLGGLNGMDFEAEAFTLVRGGLEVLKIRRRNSGPPPFEDSPAHPVVESAAYPGLAARPMRLLDGRRWQWETVRPRGEPLFATPCAWNPDGSVLAHGGADGRVRLYQPSKDGRLALSGIRPGTSTSVHTLAWSPSGDLLFAGGHGWAGEMKLFHADGRPGPTLQESTGDGATAVAFDPKGSRLAVGRGASELAVFELPGGRKSFAAPIGVDGSIVSVAWTKDGSIVAATDRGRITSIDPDEGRIEPLPALLPREKDAPKWVALSTGGSLVAFALAGRVAWFDLASRKEVGSRPTSNPPLCAAWSADEQNLALAFGGPRAEVVVHSVHKASKSPRLISGEPAVDSHPFCIAWDPTGKRVACTQMDVDSAGGLRIVDAESARVSHVLAGIYPVPHIAWNPMPPARGDALLAVQHNRVWSWRHTEGPAWERLADQPDEWPQPHDVGPAASLLDQRRRPIAVSPNGQRAAVVGADGRVRVWETGSRSPTTLVGPVRPSCVAWDPRGKWLAVGELWRSPSVRFFDAMTRKPGPTWSENVGVSQLAYSPDGATLAASEHGTGRVRFWNASTGRPAGSWEGCGESIAWSADGEGLATTVVNRGAVVRRYPGGEVVRTLTDVAAESVSHDFRGGWSAADAFRIHLFSRTQQDGRSLEFPGGADSMGWSCRRCFFAAAGRNGTIRLWKAGSADPLWTGLFTPGGGFYSIDAEGRPLVRSRDFEQELVAVVIDAAGKPEILRPSQFFERYHEIDAKR